LGYDIVVAPVASLIGLVIAFLLARFVIGQNPGTRKMREISRAIHDGAMTFLQKEYRILAIFVLVVAVLLAYLGVTIEAMDWKNSPAFISGAICSALAGNIGMRIATMANVRTAWAAKNSIHKGLRVAFSSGAVMGLCVVGIGLMGVSILYMLVGDPDVLFSFGFGASSIALFARVGGGIYTKSADVGADLVGKVEAGIPEDDPRNPAVIADNVGDNVGDVAGMGADLFESYVDSIIAAMALGLITFTTPLLVEKGIILPMMLAGLGILCSVIGIAFVSVRESKHPQKALNNGIYASAIIMAISSYFLIKAYMGEIGIFYAMMSGLMSGLVIGLATEYYTSDDKPPAQSIAKASKTGAATNIITGFSVGLMSTIIPVLAVCTAIMASYHFFGLYGISIAAVGMLSTLGMTLASDTYGPVADNAAGIAEMAGMGSEVRERAEALDAVGNTTAAIGKGFAIGSAALTALALFVVYSQTVNLTSINLMEPDVITGLFLGALMPFVFSAFTIAAVGKAAMSMVNEVRRQFRTIPGIMEGYGKPDYKRCVAISTKAALRQMIIPSLLAVIAPIMVGLILGLAALGGFLAGATAAGFLMAVLQSNAGGAWDNAKKYIEKGHYGGKGSKAHTAAVVGDTLGDPFKDTSGPSLNILIKLMSIVALVFVPLLQM